VAQHGLNERNRATHILLVVAQGHTDALTNGFQASEVNDRLDRRVSREHGIETVLIADIKLLKNDKVVGLSSDLLDARQADSATVAKVIDDDDFGEAAVALSLKQLDHGV